MVISVGAGGTQSHELVVGLVAPIGVELDKIQYGLSEAFERYGFSTTVIHITRVMASYVEECGISSDSPTISERKIDEANSFCKKLEDNAALAYLAIGEIDDRRNAEGDLDTLDKTKSVYLIRQLKRKEEIDVLRSVYGRRFLQISITDSETNRKANLERRLLRDNYHLDESAADVLASELLRRDEDEVDEDHGQRVSLIFPLGDLFCNLASERTLKAELDRFTAAFLGSNTVSPTRDEFCSYMAKAASLRSADLSRQVGAALANEAGDILALGCNEVPKANGGNYWDDDRTKHRDIEAGSSSNKDIINRIAYRFLDRLEKLHLLADDHTAETILADATHELDESELFDVTEYGRMTHAEMTAISDAARNGIALKGSTLYVTTFPCHNCAKHIVAAGITRVVFIEPYPKSKALSLHRDSISLDLLAQGKVLFEHFQGISPRRYRDIFEKGKRTKNGKIMDWADGSPTPRIEDRSKTYLELEASLIRASTELIKEKAKL